MAQKSRVSVAPINTLSFGGSSSTAQRFPVASVNHRAPPIDYSQYIIEGSQNEKSEKQPENQKPVVELQTQEEEEDNFVIPDEEETDILPAVKHSRPRFPASYQIEISAYVILTLVVGGLYFIAYVVGLFSSRNLTQLIYHHYPRLDLKPGDFVNDRQSYFVILLAISASRMVVCFTTFWMLQPLSQSWKRLLNFILNLLFVVIDVLIVATLFISWGFLCNNGLLGFELCNDTPNRYAFHFISQVCCYCFLIGFAMFINQHFLLGVLQNPLFSQVLIFIQRVLSLCC